MLSIGSDHLILKDSDQDQGQKRFFGTPLIITFHATITAGKES